LKRETLHKIVKYILAHRTHTEYVGIENIPKTGPVIIATNHLSRIDIPFLFVFPVRDDLTALVADKYEKAFFIGWFTRVAGGIFIDRSKADFTAMRTALDVLKQGRALGIAPEGTRSQTGQLLEAKSGTALIAIRAGVPVVPVALTGTETSVKKLLTLRKPHLKAVFGPLLQPPKLERDNREAALQSFTDEIMCQMAALLPEKYRGFYRQHPRLQEILSAKTG
jgi:1-acyl-sn-glycerol-3-phosphate acyltransferase